MNTADAFRRLAALGLSNEQIAGVLELMDEEANERKAKTRARVRKWREKKDVTQCNVTERNETLQNGSCVGDTRGEDNLQTKNLAGREKEKERSPKKATRLPENWELPNDWRDEAIKAGLPANRVDGEARKMVNWSRSSKSGAKLDWHAAWRNWFQRQIEESPPQQRASSPPSRKPNAFDAYEDIARERGWIADEPTILPGDNNDAQCVSAVGGRHSGAVVDLRPGAFRRFRSGN